MYRCYCGWIERTARQDQPGGEQLSLVSTYYIVLIISIISKDKIYFYCK